MTTWTPESVLSAFATAERVLPRDAMQQVLSNWDAYAPVLLDHLAKAARTGDASGDENGILFFTIYLAAQMREARAFRPLCEIAAQGRLLEEIMGDGLTEDLAAILARVYDGEPAPLYALLESEAADDFARTGGFEALARLTRAGRIDRASTFKYVRNLFLTLQPQNESDVWIGWQDVVSRLGFQELTPQVETLFQRQWISPTVMSINHFQEDMQEALAADDPALPYERDRLNTGRLDDVIAYVGSWDAFSPKPRPAPHQPARLRTDTTVTNPLRHVGRNDPCPCGSGKKFKKCCLEQAA